MSLVDTDLDVNVSKAPWCAGFYVNSTFNIVIHKMNSYLI